MHLAGKPFLCTAVAAGRSRSVKNAADTKHFSALALEKCKYRRFSRPAFTAMHKKAIQFAGSPEQS